LRRESISTTPMFEFSSDNARLGFKLSELALRIIENEELSGFVGKIGSKLSRDGEINNFEKAVLAQVFESARVEERVSGKTEIKESRDLDSYYDKYIKKFY